jgi:hypothetical protein
MKKSTIILRASMMLAAISVLVVGVTYAALTSTATLTNNTLASETAELFVSKTPTPTSGTDTGFAMTDIVPGGPASGPHTFYLKNNGGVDLGVTVYATPSAVTGTLDNTKVHFCFTKTSGPSTTCFTRAEMLANFNTLPGGALDDGDTQQYDLNVTMDADAVTGGSASVAAFDLVFTGTQQ